MKNPLRQLLDLLNHSLTQLGSVRDGLLVVAGVLYVLGYAVWSLNAYYENLGWLPAFEGQYFIAGIVPFLICVLIYILLRIPWQANVVRHRKSFSVSTRLWLRNALMIVIAVFAALRWRFVERVGLAGHRIVAADDWVSANDWIIYVAMAVVFLLSLPTVKPQDLSSKQIRVAFPSFLIAIFVLSLGALAFIFFTNKLYSRLPQSLGGVRPRCARLDLHKKTLSQTTLDALVPKQEATLNSNAPDSFSEVAHSFPVDVMFSGSDYVLIKVGQQVFEIKKDAVQAIRPCST